MADKAGCLTTPKSPASTAGNTSLEDDTSFNVSRSISKGELKNDVLILRNPAWRHALESPEEIARLSRSICRVSAILTSPQVPAHAVVAWRIFQAADRGYNGYITPEELKKVSSSIIPSMSRYEFTLDDTDEHDGMSSEKTVLFWDVLLWWREARMPRQVKSLVEENVLTRLVVPSDGLWAGVSLNASLRIWKHMCRNIGYLYRYCGENYLSSACRSIQNHGLSRDDTLYARIELVCLFIQECLQRVHVDLNKVWKSFVLLDQDARGYLNQDHLEHLSEKLKLTSDDFFTPLIHQDRILSRSESSIDEYSSELDSGQRFMLVEILDFMLTSSDVLSAHLDVLPGRRNPSGGFWDKMKKKLKINSSTDVGKIIIDRLKSGIAVSNVDPVTVFRMLVKQYLDLEQWRGQLLAIRESDNDHP